MTKQPAINGLQTSAGAPLEMILWVMMALGLCGAAVLLALLWRQGFDWSLVVEAQLLFLMAFIAYTLDYRIINSRLVRGANESSARVSAVRTEVERFNRHVHALHDFANSLAAAPSTQEAFELVTTKLVSSFGYDASQLWIFDPKSRSLSRSSASGLDNPNVCNLFSEEFRASAHARYAVRLLYQALKERKSLIINNLADALPPVSEKTEGFSTISYQSAFIITPLVSNDEPVGVLTAEYHSGRKMDVRDIHLIESVSASTAGTVAKQELKTIDEKDRVLMDSISGFIGNTLQKIQVFNDMERRIEERTRQLKTTHEEVTKARAVVIQSEKLSSLGRMASGVIHEINDPLNFLLNIITEVKRDMEGLLAVKQLIEERVTDSAVQQRVREIKKQADLDAHIGDMDFIFSRAEGALTRSARIANNLAVFSRGGKSEGVRVCDILEIAREAIGLIPGKLRGDTLIHVEYLSGIEWPVEPSQMEQVFLNLVNNALDAMGRSGTITISGEKAGSDLVIKVSDNGPGIPPENIKRIFDPFFTTKPAGVSTGLGLSICAEIVRKFGGTIECASEPGRGACFSILFSERLNR